MIAGGLAQWQQRIRMATPAELASLDQQVGATHPLRPLITEEVVTRAQAQSGTGPSPEFAPQQLPLTSAVVTPPAQSDIAIPAAPQAALPQSVPAVYNQGDPQAVRDTGAVMDRIGAASGEVIRDVGGAVRSLYNDYAPAVSNAVDTAGQVVDEWGAAYDKWMPRLVDAGGELAGDIRATLTGNGYAEPGRRDPLTAQVDPGSSMTSPGMMGALVGPQAQPLRAPTQPEYPQPPNNSMQTALTDGGSGATAPGMQGALIGPAGAPQPPYASAAAEPPAPAAVPGGPPPPADPSPLSHVAVPAVKRKPDIPVKAPPAQTTKGHDAGPSAAEALNRFYADQYRQGNIPGAPATVEDARTMAGMGDLKGAYR